MHHSRSAVEKAAPAGLSVRMHSDVKSKWQVLHIIQLRSDNHDETLQCSYIGFGEIRPTFCNIGSARFRLHCFSAKVMSPSCTFCFAQAANSAGTGCSRRDKMQQQQH
jgi:hypothetical protein